MGSGKTTPAVAQVAVCRQGRSCHVFGKGIKVFGSKYPQPMVAGLAASSVLLLDGAKKVASGTLVHPNVLLCASHSINSMGSTIDILIQNECTVKTAPPGDKSQYAKDRSKWSSCTLAASTPQAVDVTVLEQGSPDKFDYALVSIKWKNVQPGPTSDVNFVTLPRIGRLPVADTALGGEMLLIQHPWITATQNFTGEPTQASAGKLWVTNGDNPESGSPGGYGYSDFFATFGSSGGGVFNERGNIVGVLKGEKNKVKVKVRRANKVVEEEHRLRAFLNLGVVAGLEPGSRLGKWVRHGIEHLLRPGDLDQKVVFKPA